MQNFDLITFIDMMIAAVIVAVILIAGIVIYFVKFKKVMAKEENIDHSHFTRVNAKEYVNFDNIISCKQAISGEDFGVLVMKKNIFLAAIDIKGYNFFSASADERKRTMVNSVALFNSIEKPVQFRQSAKAIDIEYNIEKHKQVCKELELKRMEAAEDYTETLQLAEKYVDTPELYATVETRLLELQKEINSLKWQCQEANEVLNYLQGMENASGKSTKVNQMIFSYAYDPNDHTTELSEEEIYIKASNELATMGGIYSSALESCGCRTKFLSGRELLDLMRRHVHPITADIISIADQFNSSYQALFINSDSLINLEREKIGDARFRKQMAEYHALREKRLKEAEQQREKYRDKLDSASAAYAQKLEESYENGGL